MFAVILLLAVTSAIEVSVGDLIKIFKLGEMEEQAVASTDAICDVCMGYLDEWVGNGYCDEPCEGCAGFEDEYGFDGGDCFDESETVKWCCNMMQTRGVVPWHTMGCTDEHQQKMWEGRGCNEAVYQHCGPSGTTSC